MYVVKGLRYKGALKGPYEVHSTSLGFRGLGCRVLGLGLGCLGFRVYTPSSFQVLVFIRATSGVILESPPSQKESSLFLL